MIQHQQVYVHVSVSSSVSVSNIGKSMSMMLKITTRLVSGARRGDGDGVLIVCVSYHNTREQEYVNRWSRVTKPPLQHAGSLCKYQIKTSVVIHDNMSL
jgi:hypothetical protein